MLRGALPDLHCPRCGHEAPRTWGAAALVVCPACGLVFDEPAGERARPAAERPPPAPPPVRRLRPANPLPDSFRERDEGVSLVLTWSTDRETALVISGLVLVVAIVVVATIPDHTALAIVGGILAPIGYLLLALAINWWHVRVEPDRITFKFRPLPAARTVRVPTRDIDQIYVERVREKTYESHRLVVAYRGGSERVLGSVYDLDLARALEQRIERRLGIADRAMPREVSKSE